MRRMTPTSTHCKHKIAAVSYYILDKLDASFILNFKTTLRRKKRLPNADSFRDI